MVALAVSWLAFPMVSDVIDDLSFQVVEVVGMQTCHSHGIKAILTHFVRTLSHEVGSIPVKAHPALEEVLWAYALISAVVGIDSLPIFLGEATHVVAPHALQKAIDFAFLKQAISVLVMLGPDTPNHREQLLLVAFVTVKVTQVIEMISLGCTILTLPMPSDVLHDIFMALVEVFGCCKFFVGIILVVRHAQDAILGNERDAPFIPEVIELTEVFRSDAFVRCIICIDGSPVDFSVAAHVEAPQSFAKV